MQRNYKREYASYQGTTQQKKRRAMRNKARRTMLRAGKVHKGDDKDVAHKTALSRGGKNTSSNWKVESKTGNRSFARRGHALKSEVSKRERKK